MVDIAGRQVKRDVKLTLKNETKAKNVIMIFDVEIEFYDKFVQKGAEE